jgi:cysteine desulfurase
VARILNAAPGEIFFTSGGTEANNQALRGAVNAGARKGGHIITTRIEHPAVLSVVAHLERDAFPATYLPVDASGCVSVESVQKALSPETVLISVMHANNEVGTLQPIREIAALARAHSILMHTDAAQTVGKIPVDVRELGVDLLSLAGHKVYAPKGVGALYVREGLALEPFLLGAGQENGRRAGTENVTGIVGLGTACEVALRELGKNRVHMRAMRDRFHAAVTRRLTGVRLNGHPQARLPNTVNLSFKGVTADRLLEEIGQEVAASAGAACHSDRIAVSPVLEAMGIPPVFAKGTLRFSTGKTTTPQEIDHAADAVVAAVLKLRKP